MAQSAPRKQGLRERKKDRTRRTIVRVALELFGAKGYQATTLAEIAEAAEVSPSTLHAYFPAKDDIVFCGYDSVVAAARARLVARGDDEPLMDALKGWVDEMPGLIEASGVPTRQRRALTDDDESLQVLERSRSAALEDVFAEAFARDLGETADDLRSRLLASITVNGLRAVWLWWFTHSAGDLDDREPFALDATYLVRLVKAAEAAIEELPMPAEHFNGASGSTS